MEIAEFLLARIAEDRDAAQAEWDWMIERHGPDFWTTGEGGSFADEWQYEIDRDASLHVSPRRVLAECEAKRQLVLGLVKFMEGDYAPWNEDFLRLLALPYANHPDYQSEWTPLAAA